MSTIDDNCPCGKKINKNEYVSVLGVDYCSDECATVYSSELNKPFRLQEQEIFISDWSPVDLHEEDTRHAN